MTLPLKSLLQVLPEAMMLVTDGRIVAANQPATQLVGRDTDEPIVGVALQTLVDDPPLKVERYLASCSRSGSMLKGALSFKHQDGSRRCQCEGAVVRQREGDAPALIVLRLKPHATVSAGFKLLNEKIAQLNAEITTRRRSETMERAARRKAEEANRSKDAFLAVVSHELRTPLQAILGWLSLLDSGKLDEAQVQKALEIIKRNSNIQRQLIEDLLDFSRVTSGRMKMSVELVDVNALVKSAVDVVRHAARAKSIALEIASDYDGPIAADPARIQQVIWNLLSNAVKFTPANGRINVNVKKRLDEDEIEIEVRDNGEGFPQDFAPHIFDRFRQANETRTRTHTGLGLGLALVKHIVTLHGGRCTAESPGEGLGASLKIWLPISHEPREDSALTP